MTFKIITFFSANATVTRQLLAPHFSAKINSYFVSILVQQKHCRRMEMLLQCCSFLLFMVGAFFYNNGCVVSRPTIEAAAAV